MVAEIGGLSAVFRLAEFLSEFHESSNEYRVAVAVAFGYELSLQLDSKEFFESSSDRVRRQCFLTQTALLLISCSLPLSS